MKFNFNKKTFCVRMGNEVHKDEQYHLAKTMDTSYYRLD